MFVRFDNQLAERLSLLVELSKLKLFFNPRLVVFNPLSLSLAFRGELSFHRSKITSSAFEQQYNCSNEIIRPKKEFEKSYKVHMISNYTRYKHKVFFRCLTLSFILLSVFHSFGKSKCSEQRQFVSCLKYSLFIHTHTYMYIVHTDGRTINNFVMQAHMRSGKDFRTIF